MIKQERAPKRPSFAAGPRRQNWWNSPSPTIRGSAPELDPGKNWAPVAGRLAEVIQPPQKSTWLFRPFLIWAYEA